MAHTGSGQGGHQAKRDDQEETRTATTAGGSGWTEGMMHRHRLATPARAGGWEAYRQDRIRISKAGTVIA